jgi:hypothetical protein
MLLIEFVGDDVFMVFMVALALLLFIRFRDVLMLLCMLLSAVCGRAIGIPSKPWWYLMCDEMWSSVRCGDFVGCDADRKVRTRLHNNRIATAAFSKKV